MPQNCKLWWSFSPQALPVIKVVGPHKRAPDWTAAKVLTAVAYRQACEADPMEAQASLRLAYGEVVNSLEREIEGMTDGQLLRHSCRARPVRVEWKMIMPPKVRDRHEDEVVHDGWQWTMNLVKEAMGSRARAATPGRAHEWRDFCGRCGSC